MIAESIILGIIEGLTEFLPVSSTGHLIIANAFIPLDEGFEPVFNIVIQFGAILAVVFYYRTVLFPSRAASLSAAGVSGGIISHRPDGCGKSSVMGAEKPFSNDEIPRELCRVVSLWKKIIAAFIPAAALGFFIDDILEKYLFNTKSVALALVAGAFLMMAAQGKGKGPGRTLSASSVTMRQALVIGLFQCLALWPGMSRSASTIAGGLFAGLAGSAAAEFSFFLGVPTIMMASIYRLMKTGLALTPAQWAAIATGTAVSFLTALIVIRFFISYLKKRGLLPFSIYRIVLGIVILLFYQF